MSPSQPVPACTFDRRHIDEGGGAWLDGENHGPITWRLVSRSASGFFGDHAAAYPPKRKAAVPRPPLPFPKSAAPRSAKFISQLSSHQKPNEPFQKVHA